MYKTILVINVRWINIYKFSNTKYCLYYIADVMRNLCSGMALYLCSITWWKLSLFPSEWISMRLWSYFVFRFVNNKLFLARSSLSVHNVYVSIFYPSFKRCLYWTFYIPKFSPLFSSTQHLVWSVNVFLLYALAHQSYH